MTYLKDLKEFFTPIQNNADIIKTILETLIKQEDRIEKLEAEIKKLKESIK